MASSANYGGSISYARLKVICYLGYQEKRRKIKLLMTFGLITING